MIPNERKEQEAFNDSFKEAFLEGLRHCMLTLLSPLDRQFISLDEFNSFLFNTYKLELTSANCDTCTFRCKGKLLVFETSDIIKKDHPLSLDTIDARYKVEEGYFSFQNFIKRFEPSFEVSNIKARSFLLSIGDFVHFIEDSRLQDLVLKLDWTNSIDLIELSNNISPELSFLYLKTMDTTVLKHKIIEDYLEDMILLHFHG